MRKLLFLLAVSFITSSAVAQQNLRIDVAKVYGITYADGSKTVAEKWPAGQDTVKLHWAWTRWHYAGMSLATFRTRYVGCAVAKDVAWMNEAPNNLISGYQNTFTYGDWSNALGAWYMNTTADIPRAGMEGSSSFWYAGNGGDQGQVATEFLMDDATWWPSTDKERRLFETPNAELLNNYSYNESMTIQKIKLTGPDKEDGIIRIGLFIRRAGECSYFTQIRSDQFSYGIVFNGGVPVTFGTLTTFYNSICGVCGLGSALATFCGQTISGDSNKELTGTHPGYGSAAGGIWTIGLLKSEEDITAGTDRRDQIVGYYEGQYTYNIGNVNFSNGSAAKPMAMFVLNPTLGGGANQNSYINAQGVGFGYKTLVQNLVKGTSWSGPGDYSSVGFEHYAKYDRLNTGIPEDIVKSTGGTTTPPTGAKCTTWTTGAWGMCTNNVQTRSVTAGPTGCAGTPDAVLPASSQACGTPPPAPVLVFAATFNASSSKTVITGIPGGNLTAQFPQWSGFTAVSASGATTGTNTIFPYGSTASKVVLMGVTFTGDLQNAGQWVNSYVRSIGGQLCDATGKPLAITQPKTGVEIAMLELPLPAGTTLGYALGLSGANSVPMKIKGLQIYK